MTQPWVKYVLLAVALLALSACAAVSPGEQLARAIERMESLQTVHFEMRGAVRADSPFPEQQPAGGAVKQDVRAWGDIAFPDRLHLFALTASEAEPPREFIVVGQRVWAKIGGEWRRIARTTNQTDPRAALDVLRGPGEVRHAGYGLNGGTLTYHLRVVLDEAALAERQRRRGDSLAQQLVGTGRLDVFIGVFDGRIYRQEVEIVERSGTELTGGSGLFRIRTSYAVDYSGFDAQREIRPPDGG